MKVLLIHNNGYGIDYGVCNIFSKYEFYNSLIDALNNVIGDCAIVYEI